LSRKKKVIDGRAVLGELIKRHGELKPPEDAVAGDRTYPWRKDLFNRQLALVDDESRFKAALCSRRAGKTHTCCYYMIEEAFKHPNSIVAYIAITRQVAKRLMWNLLKQANRQYHIGMKFNNVELIATLRNGSQIILNGANDEADVDKLRGSGYPLVIIDEAASYGPFLTSLIEEVIEPALIDYNGTLMLTGTPNARCSGYFYDATTNPKYEYSVHKWTVRENPYIPHAAEFLAKKLQKRNWTEDNPVFQREWCGKWVKSFDSLIYKYTDENIYMEAPDDSADWEYVLGVDLGYADATAFVVLGFSRDLPDCYIVETYKESKMIPTQIAHKIIELNEHFGFVSIVADTGGLGRSIVEEIRQRFGVPIQAAEKKKKASFIEIMNDDLFANRVMVPENCPILDEWDVLQWDESRLKEDGRFENHLSDAALYAWRECRHYTYKAPVVRPRYGTSEYWDMIEQEYIGKLEKGLNDDGPPAACRTASVLAGMQDNYH